MWWTIDSSPKLMNWWIHSSIAERSPKMQKFIRFKTFIRFINDSLLWFRSKIHSLKVEQHGDGQQGKWVMNFFFAARFFCQPRARFFLKIDHFWWFVSPERMIRARFFFRNRPFLMREQYLERSFLLWKLIIWTAMDSICWGQLLIPTPYPSGKWRNSSN